MRDQPVHLLVCVGKDCRRGRGFAKLLALAASTGEASAVPCQGVCRGPVVGVERAGELRWYERVRADRRRALARLVRTGRGRSRLRDAEVRKRRGALRHPGRRRPLGLG